MIPKRVILHCTASKNGQEYPIEKIRQDHIQNRGFSDVGYHLVIQPDGSMENGRSLNAPGAHCEGENHDSIGIALVGTDRFTKAQFESLRRYLDGVYLVYSIGRWDLCCHYEFDSAKKQGKTCPNMSIGKILIWYHMQDEYAIREYLYHERFS